MIETTLFRKIEDFATELLTSNAVCELCYHNVEHTKRVVQNVERIGKHEGVSEKDLDILRIIAWFHDLGYSVSYIEHEDASIAITISFLRNEGMEEDFIDTIISGINATRVPQRPMTKLERIIADADLFDLGSDHYFEKSQQLFDEWNKCLKPSNARSLWELSLQFLKDHSYFTQYGIDILAPKKEKNMRELEERLKLLP